VFLCVAAAAAEFCAKKKKKQGTVLPMQKGKLKKTTVLLSIGGRERNIRKVVLRGGKRQSSYKVQHTEKEYNRVLYPSFLEQKENCL
jgi:hypothetical protein